MTIYQKLGDQKPRTKTSPVELEDGWTENYTDKHTMDSHHTLSETDTDNLHKPHSKGSFEKS